MILQPFPDIDGAQHWYVVTKDGLQGLRQAASAGANLSDETLDELFGMTASEWQVFYRRQSMRHEMFATLALFAACEGGIRRDFAWRVDGNFGQQHHQRFNKLHKAALGKHIPFAAILDTWKSAQHSNDWLLRYLKALSQLFTQRNDLAHGRDGGNAAFEPIYHRLDTIRCKWKDAVKDFRGY